MVTMLDWINARIEQKNSRITYKEWCDIRRNGSDEEIEKAVEKMMAQGGYENLDR